MTKEEYELLLKSDYWKGYSYSLIKERNYTCHDCGRRFPGERNKLQVHHLHYRDVNPWSYDPNEVVVLCEECHRRRHGLEPTVAPEPVADMEHTKTDERFEGTYGSDSYEMDGQMEKLGRSLSKYWFQIVMAGCVLALVYVFYSSGPNEKTSGPMSTQQMAADPVALEKNSTPRKKTQSASTNHANVKATTDKVTTAEAAVDVESIAVQEPVIEEVAIEEVSVEQPETNTSDAQKTMERAKTTLELLEERTHANAVESAKRAGVSTEGTTSEILDRITHANAVKSAQRAGVSTEGTTSEILDRITHANAVESAKRAGVSTEGTTSEILDRITHANAVQSAKRAGVSTEGTTSEILDRITRKQLEEGY